MYGPASLSLRQWEGDAQKVSPLRPQLHCLQLIPLLLLLSPLSLESPFSLLAVARPQHSTSDFLDTSGKPGERLHLLSPDTAFPVSQHRSETASPAVGDNDEMEEKDKTYGMGAGKQAPYSEGQHADEAAPTAFLQEGAWITKQFLQQEFMRKAAVQARAREEKKAHKDRSSSNSGHAKEARQTGTTGGDDELAIFERRGTRSWRSIFDSESTAPAKAEHREAPRDEKADATRHVSEDGDSAGKGQGGRGGEADPQHGPKTSQPASGMTPLPSVSFLEYHSSRPPYSPSAVPDGRHIRAVRTHLASSAPPPSLSRSSALQSLPAAPLSSASPSALSPDAPSSRALPAGAPALHGRPSLHAPSVLSSPEEAAAVSHLQTKMQFVEQVLATALSGGAQVLAQNGGLPASGGVPMQQVTMAGMRPTVMGPADYGMVAASQELGTVEIALIIMGCLLGIGLLAGLVYFFVAGGRRRRRR
ncbi:conserved hypothetical protein [Neospora caninum Liverpool]|uniref:Transmembrane protein n=1 Tax=Neospora caninum (strain Liverpool) TaxID=572307 RepID=F0VMR0_NEOCL|nr:conserved hypothetical protein [Neospora caninum Liverpool]CBZ55006.1 conserved hypothetical protein [Neospora caninum Liverpool]CEL69731.1 TPA: hypothetical protein BN1204_054330 [Neospora caninum Liverpool]|eukprot:XP_003885034.1 conserved hypothetical protein [Neospora caninum Liverpool]